MSLRMRGVAPFGELVGAVHDREGVGWAWGLISSNGVSGIVLRNCPETKCLGKQVQWCRRPFGSFMPSYSRPNVWHKSTHGQRNKTSTPTAQVQTLPSRVAFSEGHGLNSSWLDRISFQMSLHSVGSIVVVVDVQELCYAPRNLQH